MLYAVVSISDVCDAVCVSDITGDVCIDDLSSVSDTDVDDVRAALGVGKQCTQDGDRGVGD